jgi:predicted DNA-binding transcriptional regulator AlpA
METRLGRLLTTAQTAELLGVSESFLNKQRLVGGFIPYVKFGSRVAYDTADIAAWIARNKRSSTSEAGS